MARPPTEPSLVPPPLERLSPTQRQVLADIAFANTVPELVERIRALPEGHRYTLTIRGTCMVPDGIFHDDTVIMRRQDHATNGQLVAVHYYYEPLGLPWLTLKYYHAVGSRLRLVAADTTEKPIDCDRDQVQILGVLVGVEGTVMLPLGARPAGCTAGSCDPERAGSADRWPAGSSERAWGGPFAMPATTTVVLLFMAVHARLIEAVAAGGLPRATVGALAVPGALAVYGTFHTSSLQARVVLMIVAFHLLLAAVVYAAVVLLEALGPHRPP